jgi:hypothetical protein
MGERVALRSREHYRDARRNHMNYGPPARIARGLVAE